MKQTKRVTWVLWCVTALALGAGVVAGLVVSRLSGARAVAPATSVEGQGLAEVLHLSDPQRTQMRGIWEATRDSAKTALQDAQDAQRDRDNLVFSMLSPDQKLQYDKITKECAQRIEALKAKRDQAVQNAIAQTRQILSPEQRALYENLIRDRLKQMPSGLAQDDARVSPGVAEALYPESAP